MTLLTRRAAVDTVGSARSLAAWPSVHRKSKFGAFAAILAMVLATLVGGLGAAAPASAADRTRMEIIMSGYLRADVMWGSQSPSTGVFLWPDNTSASQEFDLLDDNNGFFRIRARHSGMCLAPYYISGLGLSSSGNGTRVVQLGNCLSGYAPVEWYERRVYSAYSNTPVTVLVNRKTGRCLDAENPLGGWPRVESVLQLWDCIRSADVWNVHNQAVQLAPAR